MHPIRQDPRDPDFVQDPTGFYDRARAHGDVVHWQAYDMPAAVSHRAVMAALRDRRLARVPPGGFAPMPDSLAAFAATERRSLLNLEGPDHARLRRAVLRRFTSAGLDGLDGDIAALCDRLIDDFPDGPFDIVAAYATPIPVQVIARLLGVEAAMAPDLLAWSRAIVAMYLPAPSATAQAAAEQASADFIAVLDARIARPETLPPGALLAELTDAMRAGQMTRDDVISTAILLLNAGHEATVHALGNAIRRLIQTGGAPALTAPDRGAATVEECLRLDAPLHLFTRWAQTDFDFFGVPLKPGDQVACLLAAANRDPAVFPDPGTFRLGRTTGALCSFGAGVHFCLGAPLARKEMQIALARLFARCPDLRLAAPPRLADIYHFHGHDRLMVQL